MKRIRICNFGRIMLKLFCVTTILLSVYLLFGFFGYYQKWFDGPAGITQQTMYWLIRLGIGILVEALIFWIGIITVYLTSEQLGIRWRVLGIVCGWIPILHLIMLHIIIKTVDQEIKMERMRDRRNQERKEQHICQTKYLSQSALVRKPFLMDTSIICLATKEQLCLSALSTFGCFICLSIMLTIASKLLP